MADAADYAQQAIEVDLADSVAAIPRYSGEAATLCEDCGETIPALRREKVPGCVRCVDCESAREGRRA